MLAKDLSNYTETLLLGTVEQWVADGFGLGIVQALTPPPGKPHAGDSQYCALQAMTCRAGGMVVDSYLFWQDGLTQPFSDRIALMTGWDRDVPIRQWWVDLEAKPPLSGQALTDSVSAALVTADAAPSLLGRRAGFYSAQWWINWYVENGGNLAVLDNRPVWFANWNGLADASDTLYGGQPVAIKQYAGTQPDGTDLNVLSATEEALLQPPPDPLIGALAYVYDDLGDRLLAIQAELQRVRAQFIGPRPV